jgi:nitrogen fixation protein FixH
MDRLIARLRRPNVWIPSIFFGMFGIIIAANGIMIFIALSSWTGLTTQNAYEEGVAYNEALREREAQLGLGWDLALDVGTPGARVAEVAVALTGPDGNPLIADQVRVGFVRPTHEGYDSIVTLDGQGDGTYTRTVQLPLAGLWELRIAAQKGEDELHHRKRVVVE